LTTENLTFRAGPGAFDSIRRHGFAPERIGTIAGASGGGVMKAQTMPEPPAIKYGRLSVYILGGVGELYINGNKFENQPPFTAVPMPVGTHTVELRMFNGEDSRTFRITVRKDEETLVEYEPGKEPSISYAAAGG